MRRKSVGMNAVNGAGEAWLKLTIRKSVSLRKRKSEADDGIQKHKFQASKFVGKSKYY